MSRVFLQPQVEAPAELSPDEQVWEAQGLGPTWKWQSERRMMPMNTRGYPTENARAMVRAFPGIKRVRMPFNKNFFGRPYPGMAGMHPQLRDWIRELVASGYSFLWVQMDGPSQETAAGGGYAHYPQMYPGEWPVVDTLQQWRDWLAPGGPASNRHIANFQALFDWVRANEPDMIIEGFEAINEPAAYRRMGQRQGAEYHAEAMGYYVNHVLRIYDFCEANFPGRDFYIDGWGYATDFAGFRDYKLALYGGASAFQVFRSRIPSGRNGRLVWSAHHYFDWMATPYSHAALRADFDKRFGLLFEDRLNITETSLSSESDDWRFDQQTDFNRFLLARIGDWYQDRGVGFGWFTALNYGGGLLIRALARGEIEIPSQGNFANFYNLACRADRTGDLVLVERSGPQPLHKIRAAQGLENQPFDPNPGTTDPAQYFALGFGGRGVCVLQGDDDANNFLFGGTGKTILYGGALDNYLYLGIGGGIARGGPGTQNTFGTNGGDNLIYTGPGENLVTCIHGSSTIVCDPAGVTRIYGFDPAKGDRLSFRGAFPNSDALLAATQVVTTGSYRGDPSTEITTPQGGKVILLHQKDLAPLLSLFVRDLRDGWYAPGWSEPVDYTPADFNTPMAPVPPILGAAVVDPPVVTGPRDSTGRPVVVRDARGALVRFQLAY